MKTLYCSISGAHQDSIDDLIQKFKRTYNRNGKYDLTSQVPYLSKLADHYKQKYEEYGDWTDCLKVCENQNLFQMRSVERIAMK